MLAIVCALLPIIVCGSVLHGILEGYQRFDVVNLVRIPSGALSYLAPLAVLGFTDRLPPVVAAVAAVRVATVIAFFLLYRAAVPQRPLLPAPTKIWLSRLLRFGGQLTVSNVVGPLMVYLDRFVIGAIVSLSAVAYYTTPFEVVTKLWIVPSALGATLFPAFAAASGRHAGQPAELFRRGTRLMFMGIAPLVFATVTFAPEALQLWLGDDFAAKSTTVARLLAAGVLVNSMAFVPLALIQGAGRAGWTARLHLCELPFYLGIRGGSRADSESRARRPHGLSERRSIASSCSASRGRLLPDRRLVVNGLLLTAAGAGMAGAAALLEGGLEQPSRWRSSRSGPRVWHGLDCARNDTVLRHLARAAARAERCAHTLGSHATCGATGMQALWPFRSAALHWPPQDRLFFCTGCVGSRAVPRAELRFGVARPGAGRRGHSRSLSPATTHIASPP